MYSFLLKNKYLIQKTIIIMTPIIVDIGINLLAKRNIQ
jgi:hypothetical protein